MEFFDELADLCAREMKAAVKAGSDDRKAAVVEGLATILGRTIAMAADGDPRTVETLLTGSEAHAAREAADFSSLIHLAVAHRLWRSI